MKKFYLIFFLVILFATANAQDPQQALVNAVNSGKLENVEIVLSQGADLNKPYKDGLLNMNALQTAIKFAHVDIAIYLINKGADPNETDKFGLNSIQILADTPKPLWEDPRTKGKDLEIAKLLIDKGVKYKKKNAGRTIIDLAKSHNKKELTEYFLTLKF